MTQNHPSIPRRLLQVDELIGVVAQFWLDVDTKFQTPSREQIEAVKTRKEFRAQFLAQFGMHQSSLKVLCI